MATNHRQQASRKHADVLIVLQTVRVRPATVQARQKHVRAVPTRQLVQPHQKGQIQVLYCCCELDGISAWRNQDYYVKSVV